jgi:quinolinate synthase
MSTASKTSADEIYADLSGRLSRIVPDFELRYKAELAAEINRLKVEKDAIILGHNYMEAALFHSVADVTGDSLGLCREAARANSSRIVFCGVRFMVGGCSLAASIGAEDVRRLKQRWPGVPVVVYVNTYAAVKAEADWCCTSSNAADVVRATASDTVLFLPDEYLAANVARETGRDYFVVDPARLDEAPSAFSRPTVVGWPGRCEVHEKFTVEDVAAARRQFPEVVVLAHPECSPEVVQASDFSASTTAMSRYVAGSSAPHYLLLTECAMGDNVAAANPGKDMLRICSLRCPHMNEITLEDTLEALRQDRYRIEVPEPVRSLARRSIERMLTIG